MATKKKKRAARPKPRRQAPETLTHEAIRLAHRAAIILEKARLEDYMQLLNRPWRLIWLNLLQGIARGVGIAIGGTIVAAMIVILSIKGLRLALDHAGGVPWIGEQVEEVIGWVLEVIDSYKHG